MALNLNKTELRISAGLPKQFPRDAMVQIAFSGRSNVGKSSLINTLLGRKSLARVSGEPGKTITINFYDVDREKYPALDIAYDCLRRGGSAACTMNAANEVAVAAFLKGECTIPDIIGAIRYALKYAKYIPKPTIADYDFADREARGLARRFIEHLEGRK